MRRQVSVILTILILFAASILYVAKDALFSYGDEGGKDPFVPLVSNDGKLLFSFGVLNSINDVIVEGIMYDPDAGSIVIMNGLVLQENERAGKVKVIKIERDRVILSFENKEYSVKCNEQ